MKSAMAASGTAVLVPESLPPLTVASDFGDRSPGAFHQGEGADGLAGGQLRQPGFLLRGAARQQQRFGGEIDRRRERHRRHRHGRAPRQ
jgi:hypothetical protein